MHIYNTFISKICNNSITKFTPYNSDESIIF